MIETAVNKIKLERAKVIAKSKCEGEPTEEAIMAEYKALHGLVEGEGSEVILQGVAQVEVPETIVQKVKKAVKKKK